jgi:hypothetical protein
MHALQMHQQEMTRLLSGAHPRAVLTSIQNVIAHLDQEIKTLKAAIEQHISQHSGLQQQQERLCCKNSLGAENSLEKELAMQLLQKFQL